MLIRNSAARTSPGSRTAPAFSSSEIRRAVQAIRGWRAYEPTPLLTRADLARELGVADVWYKDESKRLGLGSFKALGGAYAVERSLARQARRRRPTFVCATDGNHGRAVAWAADRHGCAATVFVPRAITAPRIAAIREYGARVHVVDGTYDDAARLARTVAEAEEWQLISDAGETVTERSTWDVMYGYQIIGHEILEQLPRHVAITHMFVQAGVGGLAASLVRFRQGRRPAPVMITVEPEAADCVFQSIAARRRVRVPGALRTIMSGLACARPSAPAWSVLRHRVDFAMRIPDRFARDAMRLAASFPGSQRLVVGESGAAGLAGCLALVRSGRTSDVRLSSESQVLFVGTEGATDPARYRLITGHEPNMEARA
ncbi:MAG: diaminopropionate ammonia-lyase [Gemmatimonadaceae bacterium]